MKKIRWLLYTITFLLFLFIYNSFFNYDFFKFISSIFSTAPIHLGLAFSFITCLCSILLLIKVSSFNDKKATIGMLVTLIINLAFLFVTGIVDLIGSLFS
ncbi:glucan phosphoethanolaminetransferase (alkaline phosphatase superfamily) [Exiguobacterium sp. PvP048]|uniref:Uncharacterized protein n=1 Tax=Exiguobacterium sibiricum (strain DSM 17290 / CCUG 55495 / CIP 109462 / JCM 13490 / 255-15) TaxID=262543 RepID=B1YGZ6_EXIS2|nr:hypothetical protein Exig_1601 [Exiguobacterium sibiricum 255-15]